jgi:hypothetical protein
LSPNPGSWDAGIRAGELRGSTHAEAHSPAATQVDFLASKALTAEELTEQQRRLEAAARRKKAGVVVLDGEEQEFTVVFAAVYDTRGGSMVDVSLTHDERETQHRIIVGKQFYEPYGVGVEVVVMGVLQLVLAMKLTRHTDGIILSSTFPVNYFSMTEMEQWFPDEFTAMLEAAVGQPRQPSEDGGAWRFNKLVDYRPIGQEAELAATKAADLAAGKAADLAAGMAA